MIHSLRTTAVALGLIAGVAACGSSTKSTAPVATTAAATATTAAAAQTTAKASASTAAATTAPAAATTAGAATTAKPAAGAPTAAACTGWAGSGDPAAGIAVSLFEWSIEAPTTVKAGKVGITVNNIGDSPHELAIFKGDSFDALPKLANGGVDETKLATGVLLGRTEKLGGGKSCATTVDLAPGKYVMVCNIQFGSNSHAAKGQKLNFEVTA